MHNIFKIAAEEIQSLSDGQASELIARLCRAELRSRGLSEKYARSGGDLKAKDGGVDVRVSVDNSTTIDGYIPSLETIFQVKSENFGAARITKEMLFKGTLRKTIQQLAEVNGAYVIVSTRDDITDLPYQERLEAMNQCLDSNGLRGKVKVDFYDARKIADWVEQHNSIFTWIRSTLKKPLRGWSPYGPWAYDEDDVNGQYFIDDSVKVFAPQSSEELTISAAIETVRKTLEKKSSVRIVGLSGVGKTRFVQALFDQRVGSDSSNVLNAENVIYTDISNSPEPLPMAMAEDMYMSDSDAVLVIDNCSKEIHDGLTKIVNRMGCKLRLITIEYDIREDLFEGSECFRMLGSSDEVLRKLIRVKYPRLSELDILKIVQFSDRNARIALALAKSSNKKGEIARLGDAELFTRLFHQRNSENSELRLVAEVASLVYSFNVEDTSSKSELNILSDLAGIKIQSFLSCIKTLERRGLVQKRGKWRAVLPHAISNGLALDALETLPKTLILDALFYGAPERILKSFIRRIGYLHESEIARELANQWMAEDGVFGDLNNLSEVTFSCFENVAPVNQQATLMALSIATQDPEFLGAANRRRPHFARIARSIAYEAEYFDIAVEILIKFALAEKETFQAVSATEKLLSLFFCSPAGTCALPEQRLSVINSLLNSPFPSKQELGVRLLHKALQIRNRSSFNDYDFGARKRWPGWIPQTEEELLEWYIQVINMVNAFGSHQTRLASRIREIFGNAIPGLIELGLVNLVIEQSVKFHSLSGFPHGLHGVHNALLHQRSKMEPEDVQRLEDLESRLQPTNLLQVIQTKLLTNSLESEIDYSKGEKSFTEHRKIIEELANDLGHQLGEDEALLLDLLPEILGCLKHSSIFHFGQGVGEKAKHFWQVLSDTKSFITDPKNKNVNIQFVWGFLIGWSKHNPNEIELFLDHAVGDRIWGPFYPSFQQMLGLNESGYLRILNAINLGIASVTEFKALGAGRATSSLTVIQVIEIVQRLIEKSDEGLITSIEVLGMVVFGAKEKCETYNLDLANSIISLMKSFPWPSFESASDNTAYHLKEIISFALNISATPEDVAEILNSYLEFEGNNVYNYSFRFGDVLTPFFEYFPSVSLDAIHLCYLRRGDDFLYKLAELDAYDFRHSPLDKVSTGNFLAWCQNSPVDKYIFAANICKLFNQDPNNKENVLGVAEIALDIFERANDRKRIADIYMNRFIPSTYSGYLSSILKSRLACINEFRVSDDFEVEEILNKWTAQLVQRIKVEEKREIEDESARAQTFE